MENVKYDFESACRSLLSFQLSEYKDFNGGLKEKDNEYEIIINRFASLVRYNHLSINFILETVDRWNNNYSFLESYMIDKEQLKQEITDSINNTWK